MEEKEYKPLYEAIQWYLGRWTVEFVEYNSYEKDGEKFMAIEGNNEKGRNALIRLTTIAPLVGFMHKEFGVNVFEGEHIAPETSRILLAIHLDFLSKQKDLLKTKEDKDEQ